MHYTLYTHFIKALFLSVFSDWRRYFPYEEDNHRLVREIGNVTDGVEITFQFAVRPEKVESKQKIYNVIKKKKILSIREKMEFFFFLLPLMLFQICLLLFFCMKHKI